jgi:hypothetical protein
MISITTPLMDSAAGSISFAHFFACTGIVTAVLIAALVIRELLDSSDKRHHKKTVKAFDLLIHPLSFIFCVLILYKVLEVLRF